MVISFKLNQILEAIQNTRGVGLQVLDSDPADILDKGTVYTKDVDGYAELFFVDDYGLVTQITNKGAALGSGSGGLAYADIDGYALKSLLDAYATPDVVDGYALSSGLDTYAEKSTLDAYAEKSLLDSYLTTDDLTDGYISFSGNELDPDVTDGTATQLVLDFTPVDGYALAVYRNGLLMREVDSLSDDYQEYTLSGNTVSFLASGETGEWHFARYIDSYNLLSSGGGSGGTGMTGFSSYIGLTQPTGMATAAEALYQFDKTASSLNDRTTNGHNLSTSGSLFYSYINDMFCAAFNGSSSNYLSAVYSAALNILGAITIEMQVMLTGYKGDESGEQSLIAHVNTGSPPDTEIYNQSYQITILNGLKNFRTFHEYGSGNNVAWSSDTICPTGIPLYMTYTRSSNGLDANLYINGELMDSETYSNAPTGSTSNQLVIGRATIGAIFSVKITAAEFSAAQVEEAYNNTL